MNVSVLIPWRTDNGHRAAVFQYIRGRWAELPVELVVGADDGDPDAPFNVSRAFNDAAAHATGDVFVLFGADQLPDVDVIAAAAGWALEHDSWAPLFASTGAYREMDTGLILNGADPARYDFAQWAPFCTSILAVTRGAWERVNGMDERFFGWGCEDTALRMALEVLEGPSGFEPTEALRCLWHPAASRDRYEANAAMIGAYQVAAAGGADAMRELVAGNLSVVTSA